MAHPLRVTGATLRDQLLDVALTGEDAARFCLDLAERTTDRPLA